MYLGYDEAFQVHETLIDSIGAITSRSGPLFYAWVVPGLAFVAVVALCCIGFLRRLVPEARRRFVLAGGCYVAGALGMEIIDGWYFGAHGPDFVYALMVTVEEGLEMVGIYFFLLALLREMARRRISVSFR